MARDEVYRKAKQRIEKVRQEGNTKLDLSWMHLTEIPDEITSLTQLQSLDLSGNQLTMLPEEIATLTRLKMLDLNSNKLTMLPAVIATLTQLQSLDLRSNQLTMLPEEIAALTQLQSLDLRSNQLTMLPEAIAPLTRLQALYLSYNQLTTLPKAIAALTQLQTLYLSANQLTTLSEAITALTQLQSLNLRSNQLTTLPREIAALTQLTYLNLGNNKQLHHLPDGLQALNQLKVLIVHDDGLKTIPPWINKLNSLKEINLAGNQITDLPASFGELCHLEGLFLGVATGNPLKTLPSCIKNLKQLIHLKATDCQLESIPTWLDELLTLTHLTLDQNQLTDLPVSLGQLSHLKTLELKGNPLNPELAAAAEQGTRAVSQYLRAKAEAQVVLNEAKLILIGEGEVGKSCLLGALRGDIWVDDRSTTHGIEIKTIQVIDPDKNIEITLNGWDFGGQRVYRPTHQLFFSAPAVYLVVWKPREGPQQGFVKEWITLIKHREPDAKVLVIATHGGPGQRQPDIDRQEILDQFGRETVLGFFHVDSKPDDETGSPNGIDALKDAIARVAATLPEMGRTVPAQWQQVRDVLKATDKAYLPYPEVLALCREHGVEGDQADLFVRISHELGHLIHYHYAPTLRDIVILKPDWLAKAISFVLDDETTRRGKGLVPLEQLNQLWNAPSRSPEDRYPKDIHPVFLKLMERFDLSYKVVLDATRGEPSNTSLIAQLVPDTPPGPVIPLAPST